MFKRHFSPVGSVPTVFCRHSAQPFERALVIDEWSSSDDVVPCFVSLRETVRFFFLPVVPFSVATAPFVAYYDVRITLTTVFELRDDCP